MPEIEVRGVTLYYEERGPTDGPEGPKVMWIAGSGGDLRVRGGDADPLVAGCRVLAYDHRGLGRSGPSPHPPTMGDFADDALALAEALGWDRTAVMGVSFGGMVAMEMAIRAPERVERLVLVGTSSGGAGGSSYPLELLASMSPEDRAPVVAALFDTRPGYQAEATAIARARAARPGDDAARRAGREQLAARAAHDVWDRLDRITCPALVCVGRYDGLSPLANAEAIASRIPDARLAVFEAGHYVLVQAPHAWATVLDFLGASPTPRRH